MPQNSRNIYIVGAQSTGKTTLVKALQDHFNSGGNTIDPNGHPISRPTIITEVARTVLKRYNFTADDITTSPARSLALQRLILEGQQSAERAAINNGGWFISDRSGVDPIVYARKHVGKEASDGMAHTEAWLLELAGRMKESVVVVCEPGADWLTDDGVRLMPESREEWIDFHRLFCRSMDDLGLSYDVLPCDVAAIGDRLAFVLDRWKLASQMIEVEKT